MSEFRIRVFAQYKYYIYSYISRGNVSALILKKEGKIYNRSPIMHDF